jgi:hypothetical protein
VAFNGFAPLTFCTNRSCLDKESFDPADVRRNGRVEHLFKGPVIALGRTRAYVAVITAMGLVALHFSPQPPSPNTHLAAIAACFVMALCVPLLGRDDE